MENPIKLKKLLDNLSNNLNISDEIKILQNIQESIENLKDYTANDYISLKKQEKSIQDKIDLYNQIIVNYKNIRELYDLLQNNLDETLNLEYEKAFNLLEKNISDLSIINQMKCRYDNYSAILSLKVGQGGLDAQDWTFILFKMYLKFADKKGWNVDIIDQQFGEENGLIESTIEITGNYVYGFLKREIGVHRLVRISPFNSGKTRETSFCLVEVIPKFENTNIQIKIDEKDLELKSFRASGPGGQYVNKTCTAVSLKHIPTGIMVRVSTMRSQLQNREMAILIIKSKLQQIQDQSQRDKLDKLKGEKQIATWGQHIRTYVMHPYKLVKDLKTGKETSQINEILDGNLDLIYEM